MNVLWEDNGLVLRNLFAFLSLRGRRLACDEFAVSQGAFDDSSLFEASIHRTDSPCRTLLDCCCLFWWWRMRLTTSFTRTSIETATSV